MTAPSAHPPPAVKMRVTHGMSASTTDIPAISF
jgi:hypothetical protein